MPLIPNSKLDKVRMTGIVVHWTAGNWKSNENDRDHYHIVIDDDGKVKFGKPIKANAAPLRPGYAAHTLGHNSNIIGVSMACMGNAQQPTAKEVKDGKADAKYGRFPMTEKQFEVMCKVVAELCDFYDIPVSRRTVLSHAEVQPTLGIKQRQKWDFTVIPWMGKKSPANDPIAAGDIMRARVQAIMAGGEAEPAAEPAQKEIPKATPEVPAKTETPPPEAVRPIGTAWSDSDIAAAMAPGAEHPLNRWVQDELSGLGYPSGISNSKFGSFTAAAITAFKLNNNIGGAPDKIDHELIDAIIRGKAEGWKRPMAEERENAKPTDKAVQERIPEVPKMQKAGFWQKVLGWLGLGGTASGGVVSIASNLNPAKDAASGWQDLITANFGKIGFGVFMLLIFVLAVYFAYRQGQKNVDEAAEDATQAFRDGRRVE